MRLWHYTVGSYINTIFEMGYILPATDGVPKGERPAVWFSTNSVWEETCNKGIMEWPKNHPARQQLYRDGYFIDWDHELDQYRRRLNRQETHERCGGLFRIEVRREAAPYNWEAFKRLSNIGHRLAKGLADSSRKIGADPTEWWVSFEPVHISEWLAIERWDGEKWLPWPLFAPWAQARAA